MSYLRFGINLYFILYFLINVALYSFNLVYIEASSTFTGAYFILLVKLVVIIIYKFILYNRQTRVK